MFNLSKLTAIAIALNISFNAYAEEAVTLVIYATRSELGILDAPANIAVLGKDQLLTTQAEHVQQSLSQIPGVSLQRGDGQESLPGIRSAVLTGAGACGNVLILEEGIPVRGPAFCNVNELFDTHFEQAAQIEVTRGPGTTFYGSNSLLGSINVSLPAVGQDFVALEVGEDSYRRAKTAISYSSGKAQGRVYATITDAGSFRDDAGYAQQKVSWRHKQQLGNWWLNAGLTATHLNQETAGFITGLDSYLDEDLSRQNLDPEAFRDTESVRAWANLSYQTQSGYQFEITPYVRSTDMDFRLHFLPGDPLEENSQNGFGWQSALRGQLNNHLHWVVGFDADFSKGELRQSQTEPTQGSAFLQETIPTGIHYDYQVDARQLGTFAHLDWDVSDAWDISAGVRFERIDYDYDNLSLDGRTRDDGTECGFGGCRYSRPGDREDSFSNVSYQLEGQYSLNSNTRLYASLASSFRAPQATELYRLQRDQQVADLDKVRADNIEFGLRYQSESTQFSANIYQLDQRNVIIRDSDFFNIDGNRLESRGVELSLHQKLLDHLQWRIAATFSEHKYASDQISGGININGNEVDTAPNSQINTALNWQVTKALSTELELQHIGSYYLDPENLREYPGHEVLHLRAAYQISPRLSATARIFNLTNERFAERADFTTFTEERYFPGAPRTLFFGVRYNFDEPVF